MDRTAIFERIVAILRQDPSKEVAFDSLRLDQTPLRSYGIDSLTLVGLTCALEDEFGIAVDDWEAATAASFVGLVDLVERKTRPAQASLT
jgi:acyl carrier protein